MSGPTFKTLELQMEKIIAEIKAERAAQDAQWGGPDHDDEHGLDEFVTFIAQQIARSDQGRGPDSRDRLVKIAALAIAAIESHDRKRGAK